MELFLGTSKLEKPLTQHQKRTSLCHMNIVKVNWQGNFYICKRVSYNPNCETSRPGCLALILTQSDGWEFNVTVQLERCGRVRQKAKSQECLAWGLLGNKSVHKNFSRKWSCIEYMAIVKLTVFHGKEPFAVIQSNRLTLIFNLCNDYFLH